MFKGSSESKPQRHRQQKLSEAELAALLWNRDTQPTLHHEETWENAALQFTASYKLCLWIPHTHPTLQTFVKQNTQEESLLQLRLAQFTSDQFSIPPPALFHLLHRVWHFICGRYMDEPPLSYPPSFTCLSFLLSPWEGGMKEVTTTTKCNLHCKYENILCCLFFWACQEKYRVTDSLLKALMAGESSKALSPQLAGQSSTARLQGNGKEATDMTCTPKKATILLVQHHSTGRTSQDKWFCRPQMCTCSIAAAAPRKTRKTLKNPYMQQLYLQHTHWELVSKYHRTNGGTGHAPN